MSAGIAVFNHELSGGGQARVAANLAGAFARRGHRVDFLFLGSPGPYPDQMQAAVNVVNLRAERNWWRLARFMVVHPTSFEALLWIALVTDRLFTRPLSRVWRILAEMSASLALVRYLRRSPPAIIYSIGDRANLHALWAQRIAGTRTRVVISHHNLASAHLRMHIASVGTWRAHRATRLMGRTFLQADQIVAVSDAAGDDLSRVAHIPRERITTIYNPVVFPDLPALAKAPLDHPWFRPGALPVILGAGRLVDQKNFPTLIRALARVRRQRSARLVILGEGEERGRLEALAAALGVAEDMALPGFVSNPFAWMVRAGVFAQSSKWEALPTVLIEALACGCPVVSTDCPAGPSEIPEGGKLGALVPVSDDAALAAAIVAMLDNPPPRKRLVDRGNYFTVEQAADQYAQFVPAAGPLGEEV